MIIKNHDLEDLEIMVLFFRMSYFDVEEEEKKFREKHPPCDGLRKEFIECITQSDCFLKVKSQATN